MVISLIAALTTNRVIGRDNTLPWHLPKDLQHFKSLTLGKPIIMGRKTYQSIGRPLPQRQNIIITRDKDFTAAGCTITHSLDEAINSVATEKELFIIGGAEIYQQALPSADFLHLTLIHADIPGNIYFPLIQQDDWQEINREDFLADQHNLYSFSFVTLKRKNGVRWS